MHGSPSLWDAYMRTPPVTRAWLTGVVLLAIGVHCGAWAPHDLAFSLRHIAPPHLQVWRLATSLLYLGSVSVGWLINLYM